MRQVATCSDGVGLCLQTGSDESATRLWEDGVELFTADEGLFRSPSTARECAHQRLVERLSPQDRVFAHIDWRTE